MSNVRTHAARPAAGPKPIRNRTPDYIRHGTVTFFAALSNPDGKIFSQTVARHTHREWLNFPEQMDRETPAELDPHLIVDNYATFKFFTVSESDEAYVLPRSSNRPTPKPQQNFCGNICIKRSARHLTMITFFHLKSEGMRSPVRRCF